MIYLFAGDDGARKLASYETYIKSFPPEMAVFNVSRNDFDPMQIESFYSGAGLFFATCAVIFTGILERAETREYILSKLELMGKSGNIFVFLEGKLKKEELDAFKKARAELNVFELGKVAKERFNSFLLANAFGDRDKLNLWIYFRQAMDKEVGMEELIGVLFWKAKDMILKKNFSKFKETELQSIVSKLSYLLPEARSKGRDDEAAFEQFLLEAF